MHSRTWKKYEQKIAELFGYQRALMKGTDEKADAAPADGTEPEWIIDAKVRTKLSPWAWMADLVEYSLKLNKPAILVFRAVGEGQSYAVVEKRWFFSKFAFWVPDYRMIFWKKNDSMSFQKAFSRVTRLAGDKKVPGLLMNQYSEQGHIDYICIKIEDLLRLMEAKGMLEGRKEET